MIDPLTPHLAYLEAAIAEAGAAPLSTRKALLAVMLADRHADRLFATGGTASEDILAHRAALGAEHDALQRVFDVAAGRAQLVTDTVEVPLTAYQSLPLADFMVSLYNNHTVQRVRIVSRDGTRHDVHETLSAALVDLRGNKI